MTCSFIVGNTSAGLYMKPYPRFQALSWNPIANLAMSKSKNEITFRGNTARRVQRDNRNLRNPFTVYANSVPDAPLPSGPPSSKPISSWILGFLVSFILPFFTSKWGPLWVVKNRVDNAVQTVENIVEAVEKVAEEVDKIAEDIVEDLPQGKLRDLAEYVEDVAEKTAKAADYVDNIIDKVQEAEDQVEDIVESAVKEAPSSPKEANPN